MTTLADILKAGSRRSSTYDLNGVKLHIKEMSIAQQERWNKYREQHKDSIGSLYSELIKMCCEEMAEADDAFFEELSADIVMDLGNKIVELSAKGDDAKK